MWDDDTLTSTKQHKNIQTCQSRQDIETLKHDLNETKKKKSKNTFAKKF